MENTNLGGLSLSFSGRDGVVSDTTFVLISPFEMSFPASFPFYSRTVLSKKETFDTTDRHRTRSVLEPGHMAVGYLSLTISQIQ